MSIYDGTAFGAIDEQAYEDGRPSDEWLRRKIENNVAHLTITEPPVTVMRRGGDVQSDAAGPFYGDRAIAGVTRSVFLAVPVWVTATTKEVKLHLSMTTRLAIARIDPADEKDSVLIGGGVRTDSGRVLGVLAETVIRRVGTYDANGLTTFTIPVRSQSAQWAIVYLTMQSQLENFASTTKSQVANAFGTGSSEVRLNFTGTPPLYDPAVQPSSVALSFFDHCVLEDDGGNQSDVLAFDSDALNTLVRMVPVSKITPGIGATMDFMGIQPLSFMQLRSYTIEVVNRYNLRESELLSGLPERGIDSLRHGQSARSIRSKPRMVAAGPTGWMPGLPIRQETQGRHPQVWESALGVAVGNFGAPPHTLIKTGATESLSDGTVRIVMLVHACVHSGYGVGTVDWEFVATVGNWVGADTTLTQTWTVGAIGTIDAWNAIGRQGAQGKWIPSIQRAARNVSSNEYYACRDGQFLESEFGDLTLVVLDVAMPLTGGSAGLTVEVTAECLGDTQDIAVGDNPDSGQHLTCVAWSVYIVPEEEAE